jgi:hypothetical protein
MTRRRWDRARGAGCAAWASAARDLAGGEAGPASPVLRTCVRDDGKGCASVVREGWRGGVGAHFHQRHPGRSGATIRDLTCGLCRLRRKKNGSRISGAHAPSCGMTVSDVCGRPSCGMTRRGWGASLSPSSRTERSDDPGPDLRPISDAPPPKQVPHLRRYAPSCGMTARVVPLVASSRTERSDDPGPDLRSISHALPPKQIPHLRSCGPACGMTGRVARAPSAAGPGGGATSTQNGRARGAGFSRGGASVERPARAHVEFRLAFVWRCRQRPAAGVVFVPFADQNRKTGPGFRLSPEWAGELNR